MKFAKSIIILSMLASSALLAEETTEALAQQLNQTANPEIRAKIMNQIKARMRHMNQVQREDALANMYKELERTRAKVQHGMEADHGRSNVDKGMQSENHGQGENSANDNGIGGVGGAGAGNGGDAGGNGGGGNGGGGR